jgi:hypothetical protein
MRSRSEGRESNPVVGDGAGDDAAVFPEGDVNVGGVGVALDVGQGFLDGADRE